MVINLYFTSPSFQKEDLEDITFQDAITPQADQLTEKLSAPQFKVYSGANRKKILKRSFILGRK